MFTTLPPADDDGNGRKDRGDSHRNREAARNRAKSKDVAEIGPPPKRDPKLWKRYRLNLLLFLAEVFPHSTGRSPFSEGHCELIYHTQDDILHGGKDLNEVFRGGAKSTITEGSAIWASGYGHRRFFVPIGATDEAAQQALDSIQMEFETNDRLMAIFPAACHAARALEGVPQRSRKQTIEGARTMIQWTTARCVLPTVPGFEGSGAIIWPRSITSRGLRGMRFKRPDGEQARPDFVMLDDPQTDESAASPSQCNKVVKTIRRTILRLGGHDKPIACVVNATPIEPDDAVEKLRKDRSWRKSRIPILKSRSEREDLWLGPYADLRSTFREGDDQAKADAIAKSNAYYAANRDEMDRGAEATWQTCFDTEHELSAIQHAYDLLLEMGEEAWMSECMLNPPRERSTLQRLTVDQICEKQSPYGRGVIPPDCTVLVAKVDVHPSLLYWTLWGFAPMFTGYLIDYATYPEQTRRHFAHANAPKRLEISFPKRDVDAQIHAGLTALLHGSPAQPGLMRMAWPKPDRGGELRIMKAPIDGNGQANQVVKNFINGSPFRAAMYPEFGRGVTAGQTPLGKWPAARKQPKSGPEWIDTAGPPIGCMFDTNFWKTRFHRALALPDGSQGALYLYKAPPRDHLLFAEHCLAEPVREVTIEGETVYEFGDPKAGEGNHYFDCSVGCLVGASRAGISNLVAETPRKPQRARRKVKYCNEF